MTAPVQIKINWRIVGPFMALFGVGSSIAAGWINFEMRVNSIEVNSLNEKEWRADMKKQLDRVEGKLDAGILEAK